MGKRYRLHVDSDEPVVVTLEDIREARVTRIPVDIERLETLAVGDRVLLHRVRPYVALERVD